MIELTIRIFDEGKVDRVLEQAKDCIERKFDGTTRIETTHDGYDIDISYAADTISYPNRTFRRRSNTSYRRYTNDDD